jgi:hypothetical protein
VRLRCHAILKSGQRCTATAQGFDGGRPSCARLSHCFGCSEFIPLSKESVRPYPFDNVVMLIEFMEGASMEEIATKRHMPRKQVEAMIREVY